MEQITKIIPKALHVQQFCPICEKERERLEMIIGRTKRIVWAVTCECLNLEQSKKDKKAQAESLKKKFSNANIGKRYENIALEMLEEMGTENVFEAFEYIKNFAPYSGKGLHFIGDFGNGKTSLGHAILKKLLPNYNCVFITWTEFINRCNYARSFDSEETIEQILKWISKFDLVMLDEFTINIHSEQEINLACELFDRWYRDNKCFILINNICDISSMKKIPKLGKVFDRIFEQTKKCIFKAKSYRRG